MKKGIIIQASSKSNGNTSKIVSYLQEQTHFNVIDLKEKNIGHFDYDFNNKADDFNALFKQIVEKYDTIIFATPVYWYSMSGLLKVFFDRISDFLIKEKEFGRLLRGKEMAVLSCSNDNKIINGFENPFKESANYLGMHYNGYVHTWLENDTISNELKTRLNLFSSKIKSN
jgi:multimeric flavodoxin WrbA